MATATATGSSSLSSLPAKANDPPVPKDDKESQVESLTNLGFDFINDFSSAVFDEEPQPGTSTSSATKANTSVTSPSTSVFDPNNSVTSANSIVHNKKTNETYLKEGLYALKIGQQLYEKKLIASSCAILKQACALLSQCTDHLSTKNSRADAHLLYGKALLEQVRLDRRTLAEMVKEVKETSVFSVGSVQEKESEQVADDEGEALDLEAVAAGLDIEVKQTKSLELEINESRSLNLRLAGEAIQIARGSYMKQIDSLTRTMEFGIIRTVDFCGREHMGDNLRGVVGHLNEIIDLLLLNSTSNCQSLQ